jgi:hypothetical protein
MFAKITVSQAQEDGATPSPTSSVLLYAGWGMDASSASPPEQLVLTTGVQVWTATITKHSYSDDAKSAFSQLVEDLESSSCESSPMQLFLRDNSTSLVVKLKLPSGGLKRRAVLGMVPVTLEADRERLIASIFDWTVQERQVMGRLHMYIVCCMKCDGV